MTKTEFKERVYACRERSFFADETITHCLKRNPLYLMSWGYKDLVVLPSADYPEENGGFMFKVNGLLFTGAVLVILGWNDTFTVRFFEHVKSKDGGTELIEREDLQQNEVYVDQLMRRMDAVIETK